MRRRAATRAATAGAAAAPGTSDHLIGSVALGVIIVNGPTAATRFTATDQTKVVAEVQAGAGWLAGFNAWANVTFTYDIRVVDITTRPTTPATDNESRWRNPTMAALGFRPKWNGVYDYINWLRGNRATNWTYCVFFVKGYPLDHFAYASIGGPRIVMDFANDGWGPDNIDRVFAHETGPHLQVPRRICLQRLQLRRSVGPLWGTQRELRELRRRGWHELSDARQRMGDVRLHQAPPGLGLDVDADTAALDEQRGEPQHRSPGCVCVR